MKNKFKNWVNSDKRVFAKGMSFSKMYLIFVIFCFIGVIYEDIYALFKWYFRLGKWIFNTHRGVIYGPFNPLYGAGVALIIYILGRKKRNPFKTFIYGAILGGAIEYITSFFMELVIGAASWDYSHKIFNLNGRTTIPYALFWGLLIMLLIKFVYPFISKLIEKIPYKIGHMLVVFFVVFMSLDMAISFTALGRQTLRRNGYPPYTFVGKFCDKHYNDEFLKKVYTNMKFVD